MRTPTVQHNIKGARKRCFECGKLVNTTRPCKSCGATGHVVAIVTYHWNHNKVSIDQALVAARLKAIKQWKKQVNEGNVNWTRHRHLTTWDRATIIFDFDPDCWTVTAYPRYSAVKYPA